MTDTAGKPAFPRSYQQARRQFLEAAATRGRLHARPVPGVGPAGEPLATDICRIGPDQARRLLILTSGIHGNEGSCGSAVQTDLLHRMDQALDPYGGRMPDDTAILLIHALNPWGMAWRRRQNADNVDLNRNFRDWSEPPPARPDYATFHHRLCPEHREASEEADFARWATALVAEHGIAWVQARFTEGQWTHPQGIYFGGLGPAGANLGLRDCLASELAGSAEALLLDIHTGLGAWGDHLLLAGTHAGSAEAAWLGQAFAPQRLVMMQSQGERHGGRWPETEGKMTTAINAAHPDIAMRGLSVEFGTHDGETIFLAERREHWAWRRHGVGSAVHDELADALHRLMVPPDPMWQTRVLDGAFAIITDGLRALAGAGQAR